MTRQWAVPNVAVAAYVLGGFGIAVFAATPWYAGLVCGAFLYSVGNMLSRIVNATLVMQTTPAPMLGRVLGNRQALLRGTQLGGILLFGRMADAAGPPMALWVMAAATIGGVLAVWALHRMPAAAPAHVMPAADGRGA